MQLKTITEKNTGKWEKILEKSGKSQGILSVRKNGNPGLEETKVASVTTTTAEESLARRALNVVSFGVQTGEELRHTDSSSLGVQTSSPDLKDAGCQCDPMLLEPDVKPVISPPMANQFCQTEQHVDDKETQSETVVNATSVNTQTEPKLCVDIALSPVKFDSPIRTHNTIISPIGSSTPIKPDFQIRIPEADSVGPDRNRFYYKRTWFQLGCGRLILVSPTEANPTSRIVISQ